MCLCCFRCPDVWEASPTNAGNRICSLSELTKRLLETGPQLPVAKSFVCWTWQLRQEHWSKTMCYAPSAPSLWALLTWLVLCGLLWAWPCCITLSALSSISPWVSLEYQASACTLPCNRHTERKENLQTWSSESWNRSVGRDFRI